MLRTLFNILVAISIVLTSSFPVRAHETAVYENIKSVIHISPEDQPVAQQLSKIQITVSDKTEQFNFANCLCVLEIANAKTTVAELPLEGEGTTIETSYTFADADTYSLTFKGKSLSDSTAVFTPFELAYSFSVKSPPATTPPAVNGEETDSDDNLLIISGATALSVLALISLIIIIKKKSKH